MNTNKTDIIKRVYPDAVEVPTPPLTAEENAQGMPRFSRHTWLAPEIVAYSHGGQTRKGRAFFPDGKIRRVWAGIADTYFSIPCHGRLKGRYVKGFLTRREDGEFEFNISND